MTGFQPLIDHATKRLKRDRELRLEVSRELENHLQAAASEYQAGDYTEAEAQAAAIKDFGDPDNLANQLWEANRFRLKLRAWAWWAARLTLLPACFVAVGSFVLSGLSAATMSNQLASTPAGFVTHTDDRLGQWLVSKQKSQMSAEQQLVFYGDESAPDPISRWRAVRDTYPEEVLYQIHLIAHMLSELNTTEATQKTDWPNQVEALRQELEQGAQLDPNNGMYDLIDAGLSAIAIDLESIEQSSAVEPVVVMTLNQNAEDGARKATKILRLPEGYDQAAVAQVIAALSEAASHPYLSMHTVDRIGHRLAQLPEPGSMPEYFMRVADEASTLLPTLGPSQTAARLACAEAWRRAEANDAQGAISVLDDLSAVNARLAAGSDSLIMLLVAWSMEANQRATRVAVWQALGDEARAAEALAASDELVLFGLREWEQHKQNDPFRDQLETRGGVFLSTMASTVPGYNLDPTPFRRAEYALLDRVALTFALLFLVLTAALTSIVGLLNLRRRQEPAALLWIGWRRLTWVLCLSVILPTAVFVAWSFSPWSGRAYGLNISFGPVVLSQMLLSAVAFVLLLAGGSQAIRQHARVLGLVVPKGRIFWVPATMLSLIGRQGPENQRLFRRSWVRSLSPVLCAACLLAALLIGGSIKVRERALARQITHQYPTFISNEIEHSQGRVIAGYLAGDLERPPKRP